MSENTRWLDSKQFLAECTQNLSQPSLVTIIDIEIPFALLEQSIPLRGEVPSDNENASYAIATKWFGQMENDYFELFGYVCEPSKSIKSNREAAFFRIPIAPSDPRKSWEVLKSFRGLPEKLYRRPILSIARLAPTSHNQYSVYRFDERNFWFPVYGAVEEEEAAALVSFLVHEKFAGKYRVAPSYPSDLLCQTFVFNGNEYERIRQDASLGLALDLACDTSMEHGRAVEVRCQAGEFRKNLLVERGHVKAIDAPCEFI